MLVAVDHVPIRTNDKMRESRLFPSMWTYVRRNVVSIFRIYSHVRAAARLHDARRGLGIVALVVVGALRLVLLLQGDGAGHVQSLILGAVLFNAASVLAALGIIGDLLSGQRMMSQRIFERVRRVELAARRRRPRTTSPAPTTTGQAPTTGARAAATARPRSTRR